MTTTADHTIQTSDGPMRLYEARPDGDPRGGVIVIMEAFGVNAHIEDVTRRFAAEGYLAVAPDLFHRAGGGTAAYDDFGKLMSLFEGLTDDGILVDVDAAIQHLTAAGIPQGKIGIVGFCFGGRVAFLAGARRPLGAAVTFYGGNIINQGPLPYPPLLDDVPTMKTPWLGLFGDKDAIISPEDVELLRSETQSKAPVPTEIVRYADADHGFHCDDRPAVYDEAAAQDGWRRTLDWFARHLT